MVSKVVFVSAFAFLVQFIAGCPCPPQPRCGCGSSGSVRIVETAPCVSVSSCRSSIRPAPISSISVSGPISTSSLDVSIDIPQNGGPLAVTSMGPITPTGIAVATDLALGGDLWVSGALPYLTAVAFEGQFPTDGIVPVSYGCGDVVTINELIGGSASYASSVSGLTGSSVCNGCANGPKIGCGCIY